MKKEEETSATKNAMIDLWEMRKGADPIQVVPVFTHYLAVQLIESMKNEIETLTQRIKTLESVISKNSSTTTNIKPT